MFGIAATLHRLRGLPALRLPGQQPAQHEAQTCQQQCRAITAREDRGESRTRKQPEQRQAVDHGRSPGHRPGGDSQLQALPHPDIHGHGGQRQRQSAGTRSTKRSKQVLPTARPQLTAIAYRRLPRLQPHPITIHSQDFDHGQVVARNVLADAITGGNRRLCGH